MNTYSPEEVGFLLGASRKRVLRAAEGLGMVRHDRSHIRVRFTDGDVQRLAQTIGVIPAVPGLSRTESLVLAELSRRPFGLVSYRAVARASSLSPAAAAKAVRSLAVKGLVTEETTMRALGRAQRVSVIKANARHKDWSRLLPYLHQVQSPRPQEEESESTRLPGYLRHAFWNADDSTYASLDIRTHGDYIADRALTTHDPNLVSFAAVHLSADAWRSAARTRGRTAAEKRFAENLARAGHR